MNPTTEYWEECLQQMQVDHEAEVRRLQERIVELEEQLESAKQRLCNLDSSWERDALSQKSPCSGSAALFRE